MAENKKVDFIDLPKECWGLVSAWRTFDGKVKIRLRFSYNKGCWTSNRDYIGSIRHAMIILAGKKSLFVWVKTDRCLYEYIDLVFLPEVSITKSDIIDIVEKWIKVRNKMVSYIKGGETTKIREYPGNPNRMYVYALSPLSMILEATNEVCGCDI